MTLRRCSCSTPVPHPSPNKPHACVKCGFFISPEWTSNDRTMSKFYSGLAKSVFPYAPTGELVLPEEFRLFRLECEERERAGRKKFQHQSLAKNNRHEARQEATDGSNYLAFDHLQEIRRSGRDDDMDLVLMGAKYFYLAYRTTFELGRRRQGAV